MGEINMPLAIAGLGQFSELFTGDATSRALLRLIEWHKPFRIFKECGHDHEPDEEGVMPVGVEDVQDVGFTCRDGYMYSICWACCCDGYGQPEHCVDGHDHHFGGIYCLVIATIEQGLADLPPSSSVDEGNTPDA